MCDQGIELASGYRPAVQRSEDAGLEPAPQHSSVGVLQSLVTILKVGIRRILATFTLPPDHRRIAIVTPLIAGGSLAGILDWRSRLTPSLERQRFPRFHLGARRVDAVQDNGKLGEEEIKAVVKQALEGLVYLHGRGFLHVSMARPWKAVPAIARLNLC